VCSSSGKTCYAQEKGPEGSERYSEVDFNGSGGQVCCADEDCFPEDPESIGSSIFIGTCVPSTCSGKQKEDKGEESHRVTICHRTCSEKNPWVRITISDNAWKEGCGHQEHTVDTCNGKDPTKWGENQQDYLLKDHGTKDSNDKEYWKYWNRACPYVRGEACCDREEESCCGPETEPPVPSDKPGISLEKTVHPGKLDECTASGYETLLVEDADEFTFCYKICNTGNTELCEFTLIDNTNKFLWTDDGCLSSGECRYADPNPWAICEALDTVKAVVSAVSDGKDDIKAKDSAAVDFTNCEKKVRLPSFTIGNPCITPEIGWPNDATKRGPMRPSYCYPKAIA